MKIESLKIKNYKQFANLELKLTYPKGHEKEGKPLDKICIIGQSGTGKTNLLEIIRNKLHTTEVKTVFIEEKNSNSEKIYFSSVEKYSNKGKKNQNIKISSSDKNLLEELAEEKKRLVFEELNSIPADSYKSYEQQRMEKMVNSVSGYSTESAVLKKRRLINSAIEEIKDKYKTEIAINHNRDIIELNEDSWKLLKERIDNYDIEKKAYKTKLFDKARSNPSYFEQSIKDMEQWENENENILEKISDDVNSIIKKFNLELKIDENTNSYEELKIKDLSNNNIINYENVSTGTKNLVSTLIPLKIHKPQDSIILIDEPENSFYPNIQRDLADLYMNVGENNQLIMATHSPLIASSFEPWEVVELKFDENNQVYREKYYERNGDHVDDYILDPRMLTWTGILTKVFDLNEDSNFEIRVKELMKYSKLKSKIRRLENSEKEEEELIKLSKKLGLQN